MEQYCHLLIAAGMKVTPNVATIKAFFRQLETLGALPAETSVKLIALARKTPVVRKGINPFTGEPQESVGPSIVAESRVEFGSIAEIDTSTALVDDFVIEVAGVGRPTLPPLPIEFNDDYHIAYRCNGRGVPVSTSGIDPGDGPNVEIPRFGETPISAGATGYFMRWESNETVSVPKAGSSRFWIEIELGKFLFPKLKTPGVDAIIPEILRAASDCFDTEFYEGCILD